MKTGNGLPNPCHGCTERFSGCAISCPKWKAYTIKRDEIYQKRKNDLLASMYQESKRKK